MELKFAIQVTAWRTTTCFNRTFMELKSLQTDVYSVEWTVLIVPLWNWNGSLRTQPTCISWVLIVPLWNWNKYWSILYEAGLLVLIVPLWNWNRAKYGLMPAASYRFNRTFMELKFANAVEVACYQKVLIVPLWNWNTGK